MTRQAAVAQAKFVLWPAGARFVAVLKGWARRVTDELRQRMAAKITESGGRLVVRSALNPLLWLCGVVSMPMAFGSALTGASFWWTGPLVGGPPILAMVVYVFLLFTDRDRLQSEDFQIKARTLEYMEQKGMAAPIPIAYEAEVTTPPPRVGEDTQ